MSLAKRLIIVEGNISAGKSTLCRMLSDELNYALFLEPTVENPFLDKFYKEPRKFALPMQLWLLKQRYITYVNAVKFLFDRRSTVDGVILDRSIFSDIVFAERNFLDGNFTRSGFDYYLELRQNLLQNLPPPHAVVYLDVKAEVCYDRIHNMRQRSCESGIPLDYLSGLDECYQNLLRNMKSTSSVLRMPWDSFGTTEEAAEAILSMPPPPKGQGWERIDDLLAFVADSDRVHSLMSLPYSIEEAGSEVEVADPDLITRREVISMPSQPRGFSPGRAS